MTGASTPRRWAVIMGGGLVLAAALLLVLYALRAVVLPLAVAAVLASLIHPAVRALSRRGVSRTLAVLLPLVVVLGGVAVVVAVLIPVLQDQARGFVEALPRYLATLRDTLLPFLRDRLGLPVPATLTDLADQAVAHLGDVVRLVPSTGRAVSLVFASLRTVLVMLFSLALIPIYLFYLLRDGERLGATLLGIIPEASRPRTRAIARAIADVLSAFVRGQLLVALILAALYTVGFLVVGLDFALAIGVAAGLLSIVPYLGLLASIVPATLIAYLRYGDALHVVGVWAVFACVQALEGFLITPRIVGHRVGLHPMLVIVSLLIGGELFGFLGVLLAVPVTAAVVVGIRTALGQVPAAAEGTASGPASKEPPASRPPAVV